MLTIYFLRPGKENEQNRIRADGYYLLDYFESKEYILV